MLTMMMVVCSDANGDIANNVHDDDSVVRNDGD